MMQTVHVIDLEKHHPGYIDRKLHWGKIHSKLFMNPKYNMWPEIDKCRYIAFICLELELQEPIMLDPKFLTGIGFDLKKRPISLTLQVLHDYVEICNGNVTECTQSVVQSRVEESRVDKSIYVKFVPPTKEEFCKYIEERKLNITNPSGLWDGYDGGKWIDTKGNPVRNWKLKLQTLSKIANDNRSAASADTSCLVCHNIGEHYQYDNESKKLWLCGLCSESFTKMGKTSWGKLSKAEIEKIVEQGKARCKQ